MFFNKSEAIDSKLHKQPRVSYAASAEVIRKLNIGLSCIALSLLAYAVYVFLKEVHLEREAYFVTSNGDFKKIDYSQEIKSKIKQRWNEQRQQ